MVSIREDIIKELDKQFNGAERIVLLTHVNPDGDALGAMLGLFWYLKRKAKQITMALPNAFPPFLDFLPGSREILVYSDHREKVDLALNEADLIVCLDFNELNRLEKIQDAYTVSRAFKILVDHHPEPHQFTDMIISYIRVSSAAELLYHLISGMGEDSILDEDMATCLFTGIMTDTGCFQFNSSYPATFRVVASLLETGIDKDAIYTGVYENYSPDRLRLMGYCMNEKMRLLDEIKVAHISLSMEELDRFNHITGDTEGFVNLPFSIEGIQVAALIIEREDHIRMSFRSKGDIVINRFARKYFNGGGHNNAAGGESGHGLYDTIRMFEESIAVFLNGSQ